MKLIPSWLRYQKSCSPKSNPKSWFSQTSHKYFQPQWCTNLISCEANTVVLKLREHKAITGVTRGNICCWKLNEYDLRRQNKLMGDWWCYCANFYFTKNQLGSFFISCFFLFVGWGHYLFSTAWGGMPEKVFTHIFCIQQFVFLVTS